MKSERRLTWQDDGRRFAFSLLYSTLLYSRANGNWYAPTGRVLGVCAAVRQAAVPSRFFSSHGQVGTVQQFA